MARFTGARGNLRFVRSGPTTSVNFHPTDDALRRIPESKELRVEPAALLKFDEKAERVMIHPLSTTLTRARFCQTKYHRLNTLNLPLEGKVPQTADDLFVFLLGLPPGLTKDPEYGLGFPREFDPLVAAIEAQTEVTELYFSDTEFDLIDQHRLRISFDTFDSIQRELNRIVGRAQSASLGVRTVVAHNWMSKFSGVEPVLQRRARNPMIQTFIDASSGAMSLDDGAVEDLVNVVSSQSEALSRARPEALSRLRSDIELVELDLLISRFAEMLTGSYQEGHWQRFFETNPFILSFTTGHPLVRVQEQASVGGKNLAGVGEKIVDFLAKNSATDNLAIFEIKRPSSRLLSKEYREGVFPPSKELTAAITQCLNQRYHLVQSLSEKLRSWRRTDLESFAVNVSVVIGVTPETPEEKGSFELFRNSLRDVDVITFDELLSRLKLLARLMRSGTDEVDT